MWVRCNPNPLGKQVGDCVIRAVAIATDKSWREAYRELCQMGEIMAKYLTDKPRSYEELAEECDVSRATVFRTIKKYLFLYKYLPGEELNMK